MASAAELRSPPSIEPSTVEHEQQPQEGTSEPQNAANEFPSLPPVDSGKQAWLFLAACWGVEAVTFGTTSLSPSQ